MISKIKYLQNLQADEALHAEVYKRLAASTKGNAKAKTVLEKLYRIEKGHAALLQKLLVMNGGNAKGGISRISLFGVMLARKLLGFTFAIKLMEYNKLLINERFRNALRSFRFNANERSLLGTLEKGEKVEDMLSNLLLSLNSVLANIRDVVFGMNDGLVEVLAATVGFSAALQEPLLVLIAGSLVAVSGALSMSGGAYLSTKYEKVISAANSKGKIPVRSALYTGLFYILGAIFPILPFAFGIGGMSGIAASIILTAIVLMLTSTLIAVLSNESISKRVAESLLISLGAAAVTIALGFYARYALHIIV
ncbi:MAG: VIT1/CCC1 transporter family protein [Candidatus Micrarchaeaceae archaeon]